MTVYVIDTKHPHGGYICNENEVPTGLKSISMEEYEKKKSAKK